MTIAPMEALSATELPEGPEWQYEPKWDGFRCIAARHGGEVEMQSKSGQPLGRYFPDVIQALEQLAATQFIVDGELIIPVDGAPSFNELQLRLHPAASRVNKLAREHPAVTSPRGRGLMLAFDLPDTARRDAFWKGCYELGLLVLRSGPRSIRLRPVLDVTDEIIEESSIQRIVMK